MNWRDWIYAGLSIEGLLAVGRRTLPLSHVAVLMYHDLAPDDMDIEAWTVVRRSDFLRQVDYVREHYEVLGIDEALVRMSNKDFGDRPLAVFTFDDGGSGNATVLLPILEATQLPVTVYVATGQVECGISPWFDQIINLVQTDSPVALRLGEFGLGEYFFNQSRGSANWSRIQRLLEDIKGIAPDKRPAVVSALEAALGGLPRRSGAVVRPMNIDELRRLAAVPSVTIGAHSHCHNLLTQIGRVEAESSIRTSVRLLRQWTGKEVVHFAYPNGTFDDQLVLLVEAMGMRSATTTVSRPWTVRDSLYTIPRVPIGRYDSLAKFKVSLVRGAQRYSLGLSGT